MKLRRKGLLFSIVALIVILVIARLTGVFQFYDIPTSSMEPTLPAGKRILATNLKSPERNSIIVFTTTLNERYEADPTGKTATFCSRLIALGGDTVQVRNGYAYLNSVLADDTTRLKFPYILSSKDFNNLITALAIDLEKRASEYDFFVLPGSDSAYASLTYQQYQQVKDVIQLRRLTGDRIPNTGIYQDASWTVDNFGPYVVPPDYFFFMGDNRHNANDSRFIGPIPVKNYKGSLISKL